MSRDRTLWTGGAASLVPVAVAVLAGCRSSLDVAMEVATARNARLAAPPAREHFFVRDPVTGAPEREVSGLYRADGTLIRDGVQREWYPNGTLRDELTFEMDTPRGTWLRFWRSGALRFAHEHDPRRPTPMVHWHPNGVVAAKGAAIAGLRVGPWVERWPNGALRSKGAWSAGHETGEWVYHDRSGRLVERGRFRSGVKVGEWERPGADHQ